MSAPELKTESRPDERTARNRALKDCEPLMAAATRDLYNKNGFRITGLPISATAKEVSKHCEKLKVMQELGQRGKETVAFSKNPPPTVEEIREAIQRLKDPETRLIDEFFWFWPQEPEKANTETAMQALSRGDEKQAVEIWKAQESASEDGVAARHNLAIAHHLIAVDLENRLLSSTATEDQKKSVNEAWQQGFLRWEKVVTDEGVWQRVAQRIRQMDDQRLTTGFGRRMRGSLPEALDKVNAELALAYAEAGKLTEAARHVKYMRETNKGIDNIEKTSEMILTPARARIIEQMVRAKERGERDPKDGVAAAKELLYEGRKVLGLFDLFLGKSHGTRNELSDDIARICNQLPVDYHKGTGDDWGCIEILKAALPFATSAELREQIEKNIETLSGNLQGKRLEPVYAALKTVQASTETARQRLEFMRKEVHPLLSSIWSDLVKHKGHKDEACDSFAIILRGISLDAWNKDHDKATAVAANNWALEYATSGELLAKLNQDRQSLATLQPPPSQAAQAVSSVWAGIQKLFGSLIILGIVVGVIRSCTNLDSDSSKTTPNNYTTPSPNYSQPSPSGTYRVRTGVADELRTESAAIEIDRAGLETLSSEITALKSQLDYAERTLNQYSQYEVDAFNTKVHNYNAQVQEYKMKLAAFNARVDAYNTKLRLNR